jgi:hypothetical protein
MNCMFLMMLVQVFMSFADHRNVDNAMDDAAHSAVMLGHDSEGTAAHAEPLLSSTEFDFQRYKYKSLSLAQHVAVYLRMKVGACEGG